MSKQLPERPNLEHLRSQAKDLLSSFRAGDPAAVTAFLEFLPALAGLSSAEAAKRPIVLHDAHSVLARQYGFSSWKDLVREVERLRAQDGIDKETADCFVARALSPDFRRCRRMIELYPGLPGYNAATALAWGDFARVQALLKSSEFVTTKLPPNDWLPLEYVCHSLVHELGPDRAEGLLNCARALLDAGADPNTAHSWRTDKYEPLSVLYGASGHAGNVEIVRLLLDRGADPNDGESVYHSAQCDRREILDLLVAHGAEFSNKLQPWGNTPMFFLAGYRLTDPGVDAAMRGIDWLLEHGADPNVRCYEQEETVLHCACRTGNAPLVRRLLEFGADPKLARKDGKTPFDLAAATGNVQAVEALREVGGSNPLEPAVEMAWACASDDLPRARKLLNDHPELQSRLQAEGGWALRKMCELGVCDGVRNLIALGVDPGEIGEHNRTALHWACFCGWLDCVQTLLAHGVPLDVKDDEYGGTPLGWAIQATGWHRNPTGKYFEIVSALFAAGADRGHLREVMDRNEDNAELLAELRPLLE